MLSYRRISRSLVTILALTFIQVIAAPIISPQSASAYSQGAAVPRSNYYGGVGGNNTGTSDCSNSAITGIGTSASASGGLYITSLNFTCTPFNANATLNTAGATTTLQFGTASTSDACVDGKVAIGINVRTSTNTDGNVYIAGLGLRCGLPMSQRLVDSRAFISTGSVISPTDYSFTCDPGMLLVGFTIKYGGGVDNITPRCATFTGFVYASIGAPVVTNTSYRDASVAFTVPTTDIADVTIETFTVTATPASGSPITANGSATPIVVTGLSPGVSYTYSVIGSNNFGTTAASATLALTSPTAPAAETDTSLLLTGTQYAWKSDTGTNGVLDISNAITLEAWVYPTESATSTQYSVICKQNSFQLFHIDGIWKYALAGTSTNWGTGISTSVPVRTGEWHHVALVRPANSDSVSFFLDGNLAFQGDANGAGGGDLKENDSPLTIGSCIQTAPTASFHFKGRIDQVAIYDVARSNTDISDDMHKYLASVNPRPRMFYDFNEGGNTTLYNRVPTATSASDLSLVGTFTSANWQDVKTVSTGSTYQTVTFHRTYLTSVGGWKIPAGVTAVSAAIVAGGGGGNGETDGTGWRSGGGGAGGYRYITSNISGETSSIVVGQGGRRGKDVAKQLYEQQLPTNGQNSSFGATSAIGGGYGGGRSVSGARGADGASGGSGGGGGTYGGAGGAETSGQGFKGGNSHGVSGGTAAGNCCGSGGGGGAGGAGGNSSGSISGGTGGNAGDGVLNPLYISGVSAQYLAGGGAGGGSYQDGSAGTKGGVAYRTTAPANTGSGGGGGGGGTSYAGGYGGSGVIIIRYIIVTIEPVFTGPGHETTTAGLTATLSVVGSPAEQLVRSYQWQLSTDSGANWFNANVGTGALTSTYTTQLLTTSLSGSQYQYRVIVTDTDTAGLYSTKTSPEVFIVVNPAITFTGSYTTRMYGQTHTDTFTTTVGTGTGNKSFVFTPNNRSYISWDTSTVNTAALTVSRYLAPGTYYETMTATDTKGAQKIQAISIVVDKADTITVTALAINDTFTGSVVTANQYSITGLVNSDTVTSITYNYTGTVNGGADYPSNPQRPVNAGSYVMAPVAVITNSDYYKAVLPETATLTINRATRSLSISSKPSTLKYGSSYTLGVTTSGSGDGALTFTTSTPSFCSTSGAVLTAIASYNTCSYSASIGQGNNYLSASSSSESTSLNKADTLTVTTNAITPVTYTATTANVDPTATVTGLKLTDTVTANSVWFQYGTTVINGGSSATTYATTAPTDADTYIVNPYILVLSSGTLDNYEGVTYNNGSLQITRAQQAPLVISQYSSIFGTPYKVQIFGGSGTGAVTATVSGGSAANCSITGDTLTSTSAGSCWLVAQKNGDKNYETQTASAYIYFVTWVPPVTSAPTTGPNIALIPFTPFDVDAYAAPYVSTVSASGDATYPIAISGSGFTNDTSVNTLVKFWRGVVVPTGDYIIKSNTLIWSKVPAGATRGRITVSNSFGSGASINPYTP